MGSKENDAMPVMSAIEGAFCRSSAWRSFARRGVLPWALDGHHLSGEVLEIGGGSGAMAAGMARMFPDAHVTVTDLDQAMVGSARARLSRYPNVGVQRVDVTAMPFNVESFDAATSYLMLHHVIDWVDALGEILRVLKPGGVFIGYDLTDTRLARIIHKADRSPHRILAPEELADGLDAAGFTDITVRSSFREHVMRFSAHKPG